MRPLLFSLFTLLALSFGGPDALPSPAFHHIVQKTRVEQGSCTATAIAPHSLLTATHCELGTDEISIDGETRSITRRLRDGNDHSIYIISGQPFTDFLPVDETLPSPGEVVSGTGFPGNRSTPLPRMGAFVGVEDEMLIFDYPCFEGDSGTGLIHAGHVISVVSLGDDKGHAAAFPLLFTQEQLSDLR